MKLSVTNTLCDGPTLRQNAVGMPGGSTRTYSTCMFGKGQIDRALGAVRVETVFKSRREPSGDYRRPREAIVPGERHSFFIETGGEPVEPIRAIHIVLDIF